MRAARLAFGGVAATVRRAALAEAALVGNPWDEATLNAAMAALTSDFQPLDRPARQRHLPHAGGAEPAEALLARDPCRQPAACGCGPATMTVGQSGDFAIDVRNTGPNDAWNTSLRDVLPDGATGGMCDCTPEVLSAQVFAADGVTPVPGKGPLLAGTDFTLSYAGAPTCELALAMLTPAAAIDTNQRLIITYRSQLDADSQDGAALTNVAGATEWFDDESSNPDRVTYTRTLTDGTPGVLDHEDAHTVTVGCRDYLFEKTVANLTSGVNPATAGAPGDTAALPAAHREPRRPRRSSNLGSSTNSIASTRRPVFAPGTLTLVTSRPAPTSAPPKPHRRRQRHGRARHAQPEPGAGRPAA